MQVSGLDLSETPKPQRGATSVTLAFVSHKMEISTLNRKIRLLEPLAECHGYVPQRCEGSP